MIRTSITFAVRTPVGIVGGGIAGIAAAARLQRSGVPVIVYESAPQLGGRLAAASYIRAKKKLFVDECSAWLNAGSLKVWEASPHTVSSGGHFSPMSEESGAVWFAGFPNMVSPLEHLVNDEHIQIQTNTQAISCLKCSGHGWTLALKHSNKGELSHVEHDHIVIALPVAATARLLPTGVLAEVLPSSKLEADFEKSRFAITFTFECSLKLPFQFGICTETHNAAVTVLINDTSRTSCNSLDSTERWILQSDTGWAAKRLRAGASSENVGFEMGEAFEALVGKTLPPVANSSQVAKWTYGDAHYELPDKFACGGPGITLAGDWTHNGRAEGAWCSGWAAAGEVLNNMLPLR